MAFLVIIESSDPEKLLQLKTSNLVLTRKHYESSLYATGAATAVLEYMGFVTVSLYGAYLSKTVLALWPWAICRGAFAKYAIPQFDIVYGAGSKKNAAASPSGKELVCKQRGQLY